MSTGELIDEPDHVSKKEGDWNLVISMDPWRIVSAV